MSERTSSSLPTAPDALPFSDPIADHGTGASPTASGCERERFNAVPSVGLLSPIPPAAPEPAARPEAAPADVA